MARTGRPSKLTTETQSRLCEAIRAGTSLRDAALCAGVNPATLKRWLARGKAEPEGEFCALRAAVARARAEAVEWRLEVINEAARAGDWKAASWWLERRRPELFARPETRALKAAPPAMQVGVAIDLEPYAALLRQVPLELPGAAAPSPGLPQPSGRPPGPRAAGG